MGSACASILALVGGKWGGQNDAVEAACPAVRSPRRPDPAGGVDLREHGVEDPRHEIGVIFENYMRFDMLASENIGLGRN